MTTQSTPSNPGGPSNGNHAALLPTILKEVLRQRSDQENRLGYQRRVAWHFFSVFLPGAGLATFWVLRLEGSFDAYWLWTAVGAFIGGVIATTNVVATQKWRSGPKVALLLEEPLQASWPQDKFLRKLIATHVYDLAANEHIVRRVKRWSSVMVGFFLASVTFLGVGIWSYTS